MPEVKVNKELIDSLIQESANHEIMTKRYNFVVNLLNKKQRNKLKEYLIDTGAIKE